MIVAHFLFRPSLLLRRRTGPRVQVSSPNFWEISTARSLRWRRRSRTRSPRRTRRKRRFVGFHTFIRFTRLIVIYHFRRLLLPPRNPSLPLRSPPRLMSSRRSPPLLSLPLRLFSLPLSRSRSPNPLPSKRLRSLNPRSPRRRKRRRKRKRRRSPGLPSRLAAVCPLVSASFSSRGPGRSATPPRSTRLPQRLRSLLLLLPSRTLLPMPLPRRSSNPRRRRSRRPTNLPRSLKPPLPLLSLLPKWLNTVGTTCYE